MGVSYLVISYYALFTYYSRLASVVSLEQAGFQIHKIVIITLLFRVTFWRPLRRGLGPQLFFRRSNRFTTRDSICTQGENGIQNWVFTTRHLLPPGTL